MLAARWRRSDLRRFPASSGAGPASISAVAARVFEEPYPFAGKTALSQARQKSPLQAQEAEPDRRSLGPVRRPTIPESNPAMVATLTKVSPAEKTSFSALDHGFLNSHQIPSPGSAFCAGAPVLENWPPLPAAHFPSSVWVSSHRDRLRALRLEVLWRPRHSWGCGTSVAGVEAGFPTKSGRLPGKSFRRSWR